MRNRDKRAARQAGEPHSEGLRAEGRQAGGSHAAKKHAASQHAAESRASGSHAEIGAKSARSRRRFTVAAWLLLFVGALFLLAPDITDFFYRANTANQLETVQDAAALASAGDATADGAGDVAPSEQEDADDPAIRLAQAGSSALPWLKDYNERVRSGAGPAVNDPFTFSSSDGVFAETGLSSGPVGVISVPTMDCELPLYLGSTKQNMALGAAVVAGTSAPIGETDSNCVIAGHRGYSGALFFREIENMKIGDTVTLSTIWGTFTYRAVEFKAVLPTDVAAVSVQPGKDLVTLSTCHPYPYNSHRYLAICERVTDDAVRNSANESSSGLGTLAGTDLIGSGGQPLLDDGSVNVLFFENVGRLVGRVLLVVLAIWAIWGAVRSLRRKAS